MGQGSTGSGPVRRAVEYDLVELVRLRAPRSGDVDGRALDSLAATLWEQLADDDVRVLVVDAEDGKLAACSIGAIDRRPPGPGSRGGRTGHVVGVVTDPDHRRHDHSGTLVRGLFAWFREHGVSRVELRAPVPEPSPRRAVSPSR
ncbi:GNAT family N-acetyltransferase [Streptomyces sp. NRRL B-24085]|uniref:GNAT family N-acetyltransferase n=1 Tax=Streptomyces sp. NRRL B-24085 TaxID=1709476 RepID=UPI0007C6519B|nr:GNAT family N-acetyltransferase [Streptomyces sp. NRRL B-24085]